MVDLEPVLTGRVVRLEPLESRHAAGLAAATAGDPGLYRLTTGPASEEAAGGSIETARAPGPAGPAAPSAVVRLSDETVIASSRLWDLAGWPWPADHPRH